jgi:hypothetical protein
MLITRSTALSPFFSRPFQAIPRGVMVRGSIKRAYPTPPPLNLFSTLNANSLSRFKVANPNGQIIQKTRLLRQRLLFVGAFAVAGSLGYQAQVRLEEKQKIEIKALIEKWVLLGETKGGFEGIVNALKKDAPQEVVDVDSAACYMTTVFANSGYLLDEIDRKNLHRLRDVLNQYIESQPKTHTESVLGVRAQIEAVLSKQMRHKFKHNQDKPILVPTSFP